jgi:hypothetical protein
MMTVVVFCGSSSISGRGKGHRVMDRTVQSNRASPVFCEGHVTCLALQVDELAP